MINLKKTKNILFLFCHPDDETLAAGGTISRLKREGKNIFLAFSGMGIQSRYEIGKNKKKSSLVNQKNKMDRDIKKVLKIYKINKNNFFAGNFPDNRFDTVPLLEIIKWCEKLIKKIKPEIIFTHHKGCTNIDHRRLYEATIVATRPNPVNKINVFSSEILSSTGYLKPSKFEPNLFIKLSKKDIDTKIKAMNCYTTEKRKYPHPRSSEVIKALSVLRGAYSGNEFAEGFMIENLFF